MWYVLFSEYNIIIFSKTWSNFGVFSDIYVGLSVHNLLMTQANIHEIYVYTQNPQETFDFLAYVSSEVDIK